MKSAVVTLVVYAYSSFVSSWGPGPELAKNFEKQCQCKVQLVKAGDGGSLLSRLKLEGKGTKADIVIGIDGTLIPKFKKNLGWEGYKEFDYGPYSFIYNSNVTKNPPKNLDDLLAPRFKKSILLQDPRLSTVGLGFLLWVVREKGEEKAWPYLEKLKNQVKIVSPSWELAYGLFKKNKGKLVFSYWTSPAYHIENENKRHFKGAPFEGGHYVQREYFVLNPRSKNKKLAKKFEKFLLSSKSQSIIAQKNLMYPVNKKASLPKAFSEIGVAKILSPLSEAKLSRMDSWLKRWRQIFSK